VVSVFVAMLAIGLRPQFIISHTNAFCQEEKSKNLHKKEIPILCKFFIKKD
jgi:hypothetical protein